ncbi:hypothetical protein CDCA_CDCA11G3097 [Cyanidium caldarium]|uniref:RNA polymerase III subunit C6 n=1 Tax=Cyanidium caldarium TaxID=2771 RepID=A0AAV9IXQ7_CYACA|nr:hypothetical protein CDCA_CDCA11G3097 [Cyanidium caldarium]
MTEPDAADLQNVKDLILHILRDATDRGEVSDDKPMQQAALQRRVAEACQERSRTRSSSGLRVPTKHEFIECVNALTSAGEVRVHWADGVPGKVWLSVADEQQRQRLHGLSTLEQAVYEQVRTARNLGVWVRHVRARLNLSLTEANRALHELQKRKLIKQVQSFKHKTRKVYMLTELEPSREVTGGSFYDSDGGFDLEFVRRLRELLVKHLREQPWCTAAELTQHLNRSPVLNERLEVADTRTVLDTMCWDSLLCRCDGLTEHVRNERRAHSPEGADGPYYACLRSATADEIELSDPPHAAAHRKAVRASALAHTPCAKCPVREHCSPRNPHIHPLACRYLETWAQNMGDAPHAEPTPATTASHRH